MLIIFLFEVFVKLTQFDKTNRVNDDQTDINRLHYVKDSRFGWLGEPNKRYQVLTTDGNLDVRNNSLGFRDREFSKSKNSKVTRIAVIGDSFIWGFGTTEAENRFTNILEGLLKENGLEAEVYNFGISGFGTDQEYLLYHNIVSSFSPDLIILSYYVNDSLDNVRSFDKPFYSLVNNKLKINKMTPNESPDEEDNNFSFIYKVRIYLDHHFYTYRLIKKGLKQIDFVNYLLFKTGLISDLKMGYDETYIEKLTYKILLKFIKEADQNGAQFLLLWVPCADEIEDKRLDYNTQTMVSIKNNLMKYDYNSPTLDLRPMFIKHMQDSKLLYYTNYAGRHWSDEGNSLVAETVAQFLKEKPLPPYNNN